MKKLTIFNTYVEMESQDQCDRMKQLCLNNRLPIWEDYRSFDITDIENEKSYFWYDIAENEFFIVDLLDGEIPSQQYIEVTEQQFINLLKEYKDGK